MKKVFIMAMLTGLLATRTRTENVIVESITNNLVTFETASGHLYQVDNTGRYETGNTVKVVFFDNFTPDNIEDDVIIFDE